MLWECSVTVAAVKAAVETPPALFLLGIASPLPKEPLAPKSLSVALTNYIGVARKASSEGLGPQVWRL